MGVEVELELLDINLVFGCWDLSGEEDNNLRHWNSYV